MSDQPDLPTFWFKCPRGHVEERPMPPEDGRTLCDARVVKAHEHSSGIYYDLCGEEMRHLGPTVAEWRAANEAIQQAKQERVEECGRLERMLVEADEALAACSAQLDGAHEELGNATQAAWLNRDAAAREARRALDDEEEEPDRDDLAGELARRLGATERERRTAYEQRDEWRVKAQTEQAGRLAAERKAQRRGFGFTLVRDVNGQTEGALRRSERHLRELRTESYNQRRELARLRALLDEHGIEHDEVEE